MTLASDLRALVLGQGAFGEVVAGLERDAHVVAEGLPRGARAPFLAALGEERPLLVVVHEADAVHGLADDLETLRSGRRPVLRCPPLTLHRSEDPEIGAASPVAIE